MPAFELDADRRVAGRPDRFVSVMNAPVMVASLAPVVVRTQASDAVTPAAAVLDAAAPVGVGVGVADGPVVAHPVSATAAAHARETATGTRDIETSLADGEGRDAPLDATPTVDGLIAVSRMCYIRGPEGIILMLAEALG